MNVSGPVLVEVNSGNSAQPSLEWAREWCRTTGVDLVPVPVAHEGLVDVAAREDASLIVVDRDVDREVLHESRWPVVSVASSHPLRGHEIIVGIDGSDGSTVALNWAAFVAAKLGSPLHAVYAYDPLADSYPHGDVTNWKYRGEEEVAAQVESVQAPGVDITTTLVGANPADALIQVADEADAALIVVGAKSGVTSLKGRIVGRVPSKVWHESARSVAIVHADVAEALATAAGTDEQPITSDRLEEERQPTDLGARVHHAKGRFERILGWLTADRNVEARGAAEERLRHDPSPEETKEVKRGVKRRYGERPRS